MAGSVKIETTITVTNPQGDVHKFNTSKTVSSLTAITMMDFAITADQTRIIWDPTNVTTENVTKFDIAIFWSDGNLDLEKTTNEGDANEELGSIRIVSDLPYMLGADDSYYNHSASDIYAGTLDVIDKLRVDEPASAARNLKMILGST